MPAAPVTNIPCYILAGGQSRRMEGVEHKALMRLRGKPLIEYLTQTLSQQTSGEIIVNSYNNDIYQDLGLRVINDVSLGSIHNATDGRQLNNFQGPLQGIYSAMKDSKRQSQEYLVTVACDTPFIPNDLVERLFTVASTSSSRCSYASSNGRQHPIIGCWHISQLDRLFTWLETGYRRALSWTASSGAEMVEFAMIRHSGCEIDPFFNINRRSDWVAAQSWMKLSRN